MCFSVEWSRPLLFVPLYKLGFSIKYWVPGYIYMYYNQIVDYSLQTLRSEKWLNQFTMTNDKKKSNKKSTKVNIEVLWSNLSEW